MLMCASVEDWGLRMRCHKLTKKSKKLAKRVSLLVRFRCFCANSWRRGCVQLGHYGIDGRLKSRLELEHDIVEGRLVKQVVALARREVTEPVVVAASQLRAHVHLPDPRHERHVAAVIVHGQTGARIDERLGRHLPNNEWPQLYCHTQDERVCLAFSPQWQFSHQLTCRTVYVVMIHLVDFSSIMNSSSLNDVVLLSMCARVCTGIC